MSDGTGYLGQLVVARTAFGDFQFTGICFSYCDAPTVGVTLGDGTQAHWRADMCEIIPLKPDTLAAIKALIEKEHREANQ